MRKVIKMYQEETYLLFFSSYVFLVNYMQIFAHQQLDSLYSLFVTSNILILLYAAIVLNQKRQMEIPRIRWIESAFFLMIIAIDLSKLIHGEYNLVLIPFLIFGKLIPAYTEKKQINQIVYSHLIGIAPFLFYAIYSFNHYPSYYNNSMGVLLAINSYLLLSLFAKSLANKQQKESVWLLIYLLVSLVTTYNTGSRTAILASLSMVFYFIYHLIKTAEYLTKEKLKWLLPSLTIGLYLARNQLLHIFNNLFFKWDGNGLDFSFTGRTGIWAYTLKNYEFFGGGNNFFIKDLNVFHGHNALFNMLGFYGVIPFVLLIIIILYGLVVFKRTDQMNVRLFIILFIIINMFEGVIGGPEYSYFQLLFFAHFGFWIKALNNAEVSEISTVKNTLRK